MLYLQKGNFQKIVRWFGGSWMTANQATFLGCVFIVLTAISFYVGFTFYNFRWFLLLVPLFLFFRLTMNTLDGMLSREYKTATVAGELWNEALDIVGDTVCYGVLLFIPNSPRLAVTIYLILTWAAEYFGVLGKSLPGGIRRHETVGGGKPDRAVWMGLLAVIAFFWRPFIHYMSYYILGVSALIFLTCSIRITKALKSAKGKEYDSYTWIGR